MSRTAAGRTLYAMNQIITAILTVLASAAAILAVATGLPRLLRIVRANGLRTFADDHGMHFDERADNDLAEAMQGDPILGLRSARLVNHVRGEHAGGRVRIFQHEYDVIVNNRRRSVVHRIAIREHGEPWPMLRIDPLSWKHRRRMLRAAILRITTGGLFGDSGLSRRQLLEDSRFNCFYTVTAAADIDAIRVLTPPLQEWIARDRIRGGVWWRTAPGRLIRIERGRLTARHAARMLEKLDAFMTEASRPSNAAAARGWRLDTLPAPCP